MEVAITTRVTLTLPEDEIFLKYYEENPEWVKIADKDFALQPRVLIFERVDKDLSATEYLSAAGFTTATASIMHDGVNKNGRSYKSYNMMSYKGLDR